MTPKCESCGRCACEHEPRPDTQLRAASAHVIALWDKHDGHLTSHFHRQGKAAIEALRTALGPSPTHTAERTAKASGPYLNPID